MKITAKKIFSLYLLFLSLFINASLVQGKTVTAGQTGAQYSLLTLAETKAKVDSVNFDNEFFGKDEELANTSIPTHLLYSPEDFSWNEDKADIINSGLIPTNTGRPISKRIPIILVHGWQGDTGSIINLYTDSTLLTKGLLLKKYSAEEYFSNFITFFNLHPNLKKQYKLFVYKYPSYKHVTFNARLLAAMLGDIAEIKNKPTIFIAHSMGALVSRSLFEEHPDKHKTDLQKMIFLDGVHHGSPGAIPGLADTSTLVKHLFTPGSNDIQWDNYDGIFTSTSLVGTRSIKVKIMGDIVYDKQNIFINTIHLGTGPINYGEVNFYGKQPGDKSVRINENIDFDKYWRQQINLDKNKNIFPGFINRADDFLVASSRTNGRYVTNVDDLINVLPILPNPWLYALNIKYLAMPISYKSKLIFFAGVNANGPTWFTGNMNNLLSDEIALGVGEDSVGALNQTWGNNRATRAGNSYGYLNDGPVPMTSQFLDENNSFDALVTNQGTNQVGMYKATLEAWRLSGITNNNPPIQVFEPLPPLNVGYEGNGYVKHILFLDYDHDRMKSGGYRGNDTSLQYKCSRTGFNSSAIRLDYINATLRGVSLVQSDIISLKPLCGKALFPEIKKIQYEPLFIKIFDEISPSFMSYFIFSYCKTCSFSDVLPNQWFYQYVQPMSNHGIVKGYEDGTFKPTNPVSRAEFIKMIIESMKATNKMPLNPPLGQVPVAVDPKAWYANYLSEAYGYKNIKNQTIAFWTANELQLLTNPWQSPITRQEAAHILMNALGLNPWNSPEKVRISFPKAGNGIKGTAALAWIYATVNNGIFDGYNDSVLGKQFKPDAVLTRSEAAKIIYNAFFD